MTRYLLDTDTLVDFSKGVEPVSSRIIAWVDGSDEVAVCAVSVAEFYAGLTAEQAVRAAPFISSLPYWNISLIAAMQAGQDRYCLARAGTTITITDALLAAVAREYRATLVTSNVKDFPLSDTRLLSLRTDESD